MTTSLSSIAGDLAPTGTLRASINLGNPVLAHGTAAAPAGVTVDIAREVGRRLGVDVELVCFDAARKSFEAMTDGRADICVLGRRGRVPPQGLEVAAGIRQPMAAFVEANPDTRLIDDRFMQIQQALGTTKSRRPETVQYLRDLVEELKADGFVADALRRANHPDDLVAPAA